jgi:hypothetical protein
MGDNTAFNRARQAKNARSKPWATNDHKSWSDSDDMVILEEWILVSCEARDEMGIAKRLHRTWTACHDRAERLRKELGYNAPSPVVPKQEATGRICDRCWLTVPLSGEHDCSE